MFKWYWVVAWLFIFIFLPWSFRHAEEITKTLTENQTTIVLSKNRMQLISQNGILLDEYRVEPWIIRDGCLLPGEKRVIVILGREGKTRGERLACYSFAGNVIRKKWIDNNRDINPWKIVSCDVDGDKHPEVAVGVWKTAKFHPVYDNRLFIYTWEKGMIYPKWLGSRLSSPFIDYDFRDIDQDGVQELIALEYQKDGLMRIMGYEWSGFGFLGSTILEKDLNIQNLNEFQIKRRD